MGPHERMSARELAPSRELYKREQQMPGTFKDTRSGRGLTEGTINTSKATVLPQEIS